jgi:hypothetical protein
MHDVYSLAHILSAGTLHDTRIYRPKITAVMDVSTRVWDDSLLEQAIKYFVIMCHCILIDSSLLRLNPAPLCTAKTHQCAISDAYFSTCRKSSIAGKTSYRETV